MTYEDDRGVQQKKFYFKAKNFMLVGYGPMDGTVVRLKDYNYGVGHLKSSVNRYDFIDSLLTGGNNEMYMNERLARLVALTSEAARSHIVAGMIKKVISGTMASVNLAGLKAAFNDYGKVADFLRYRLPGEEYGHSWRPLHKAEYIHYYRSGKFTGNREEMIRYIHLL